MLAKDLKDLVKKNGSLSIRVIAPETSDGEGNLSDHGVSVTGISTYLRTGMLADITDACEMPPIRESIFEAQDYHKALVAGRIYFVFRHGDYAVHNDAFAAANWSNDNPGVGELRKGTAVQIGCYSGYDMIGFPGDQDVSQLFEIVALV